jgi:hypothetical protein
MALSPLEVLNSARKAVPAVDYALGVAGVAAAGSIIGTFVGYGHSSAIVLGGTLVSMVLLFVFGALVKSRSPLISPAGVILLYSVILFFCAFLFFTISAVATGWPDIWLRTLNLDDHDLAVPKYLSQIQDAELRLRKVDDFAWVYVNGNAVIDRAIYGEAAGWTPFRQFLKAGSNEIRVVIRNGQYGGCGAELDVSINGKPVDSFARAWYLPTERASVNGLCFDESFSFQLR